ncbi:hypothetical protein C7E18_23420, partial [Stenotrophomonas maltophilia]
GSLVVTLHSMTAIGKALASVQHQRCSAAGGHAYGTTDASGPACAGRRGSLVVTLHSMTAIGKALASVQHQRCSAAGGHAY